MVCALWPQAIWASGLGTLAGIFLTGVINASTASSEFANMNVTIDPVKTLLFFIALVIAFTITVLFPIKNLRKMKIAEQIKYE